MSERLRIPIAGPSITQKEVDYVAEAVRSAWYEDANVFHDRFERAFAAYCGRRHAVALPSCTSALHLALLALGVGEGDEVIVPDVTWIASVAPVCYVRAMPVFADIDPHSWCLAPEAFAELITPRTKAAIVVDLYGSMPDWDRLCRIAESAGIALIEDAAEAVGSRWNNRLAGSFGTISTFSFHGSKTLTTGEGGMLLVDEDNLWERVLKLRDHGRKPGDFMFFNDEVGWKYKMSCMQAALGLAQLERVAELVDRKREIFRWYHDELSDWNEVSLNFDIPGLFNSYWMTTVLLDPELGANKEALVPRMRARGIDVRPFFHPLSELPAFRDTAAGAQGRSRNTVAQRLTPYGVNLPSALSLDRSAVARVCDELRNAIDTAKAG